MFGAHEQILKIDSGAAREGREVDEPHREAGRRAFPLGDVAEQPRLLAEQRSVNHRLGRFHLVTELFVLRKITDERHDEPPFTGTRATDGKALVAHGSSRHELRSRTAHTATSALMCGCGS